MFRALCLRRNVRLKHERYANALTASAIWNTQRTSEDAPIVKPFDYVMTEEQADAKERRMEALGFIMRSIRAIPQGHPRSKFLEVRRNVIKKLRDQGCDEAEQMFDAKWPSLKPQEGEE